jgi:outer membrane protein assembly factor BamB
MTNFFRRPIHFILICISFILFVKKASGIEFDNQVNPIIGLWQTTLNDKGAEFIVILNIQSTDTDSLACTFDLTDLGFLNIPFGKFILDDGNFTLPGFNASYDSEAELITGVFTSMGNEIVAEFNRIDAKPTFNFDYPEKEVDWIMETNDPIWSALSVSNGQLIFGNDAGNLYSINLDSDKTSWIFKSGSKIRSKALIQDKLVYFSSDDGYLYSIHFDTGKLNWKSYIGNDASPRNIPAKEASTYDYMSSSPIIDEGMIYVGSIDSCLYAINQINGKIQWKHKTEGIIRSTPIADSGFIYFGSWDNHMYAIHVKDGSLAWKYDAGGSIQSTPVIIDNKLIFGGRSAFIFGIDKNTGTELWKTSYWGSWVESSPVIYDGIIYIGSSDYRKIHAIDPNNGNVMWDAKIEGWAWTTPAVNEKSVYIGSSGIQEHGEKMHGRIYAVNRLNGDIEWKVSLDDNPDVFAYGFTASPVVWKDWVFFADLDGKIYGIKE